MEVYGYIYKITNQLDGKIYIGQTTKGFRGRYHGRIEHYTHNAHLKKAILKYGIENFVIDEELDVAYSKESLDTLEEEYINKYNSTNMKFGYNKRHGGSRGLHTEESKKKMRLNHIPITGEKHHRYKKGYLVSGGKNPRAKKVICLNTLKVFDTADEAAKYYGIGNERAGTQIVATLTKNKKLKTCGVFNGERLIWMYYSEYVTFTPEQITEYINKALTKEYKSKEVICITTKETFKSLTAAAKAYGTNRSCVALCCEGKAFSAGRTSDGLKAVWAYC